ncbi:MAG: hypothetical protein L6W00_12210 [Lentisphaeria bacterium]|nr:MAG: hypothetical protein L6W00_12210 [Lentisphaeria bacterium]
MMLEKSVAHHVVETLLAENRREQKEIEGNLKDPVFQSALTPQELAGERKTFETSAPGRSLALRGKEVVGVECDLSAAGSECEAFRKRKHDAYHHRPARIADFNSIL